MRSLAWFHVIEQVRAHDFAKQIMSGCRERAERCCLSATAASEIATATDAIRSRRATRSLVFTSPPYGRQGGGDDVEGTGSLWLDGVKVQEALRYVVDVTQSGFMTRARGNVKIAPWDAGKIISVIGPNSDLVLALEDGRRCPCVLANTDGKLEGRGQIS
jgi:hypothetical protein